MVVLNLRRQELGMNLLEQIRNEAVDGTVSLTCLLRKCQILASRLGNADLKRWVSCELNGYDIKMDIPQYRRLRADSFGTFRGYGGQTESNVPIPTCKLPDEIAEHLNEASFVQGVGFLEHLLRNADHGQIPAPWPTDVIAAYQGCFYKGLNLIEAHRLVSQAAVTGILETVRNRVLEFVLELGEQFPDAGSEKHAEGIESGKVQTVVNNFIFGNGNRVASGTNASNDNVEIKVYKGNWEILSETLKKMGLTNEDVDDLKSALKDEPPKDEKHLGTKVSEWMATILAKIGKGTYDLSVGIASSVIASGICRYCGF